MSVVADTSALVSLATAETVARFCSEFDVHTTDVVVTELEDTAEYDDGHGEAATRALDCRTDLTVHAVDAPAVESSRVDEGEASCAGLVRDVDAAFLVTDDLRALPELRALVDARVAISPIVLKALVERGVLTREDADARLERVAETRDWLGAPIYRRARRLFD